MNKVKEAKEKLRESNRNSKEGPGNIGTLPLTLDSALTLINSCQAKQGLKMCLKAEIVCDTETGVSKHLRLKLKLYKATCLKDLGRIQEAIETLRRVKNGDNFLAEVSLGLDSIRLKEKLADCLFLMGKIQETILVAQECCTCVELLYGPQNRLVLLEKLGLATYLYRSNMVKDALKLCTAVEALSSQSEWDASGEVTQEARFHMIICFGRLGQVRRGQEMLKQSNQTAPSEENPNYWLYGDVLLQLGKYEKAYVIFHKMYSAAVEQAPDDLDTHFLRRQVGWCLHLQARHSEAIGILEDVERVHTLKLDPDHFDLQETRRDLASCLLALGKYEQALELLKGVKMWFNAAFGPSHPEVFNIRTLIGACKAGQGNHSKALHILFKVESESLVSCGQNHPEHLYTTFELANCHFQMGNFNAALELYTKVHDLREENFGKEHPHTILASEKALICAKALLPPPYVVGVTPENPIANVGAKSVVSDKLLDNVRFLYQSEMEKTLATTRFIPEEELIRRHKSSVVAVVARIRGQITSNVDIEAISAMLQPALELQKDINERKKSFKGPILGLDLGTSYCCAAVLNRDNDLEVIHNDMGQLTTPSYVCLEDEDNVIVGEVAKNMAYDLPLGTIFHAKRMLGKEYQDQYIQRYKEFWEFRIQKDVTDKVVVQVGERLIKPEEIVGHLVRYMKSAAEDATGEDIVHAVVAIPAHFNEYQSYLTKQACYSAGLNVLKCITEPAAAALASKKGKSEMTRSLVFDLGGGTFDVAVVEAYASNVKILAIDGDPNLGGEDFDTIMVEYCLQQFQNQHGMNIRGSEKESEKIRKIKNACEYQKRFLCNTKKVTVSTGAIHQGLDLIVPFDRDIFNGLIQPYLDTCMTIVDKVLTRANVDIDEIVMVGGSSRILRVQEMLREKFPGKKLIKSTHPDHAVAMGAAVFGQKLKDAEDVVQGLQGMAELFV